MILNLAIASRDGTNDVANVGAPSRAYTRMAERWRLIDDLSGGTEHMRRAQVMWLPRNSAETDTSYRRRLANTVLYEGFNNAVETLLGKPFSEDVLLAKSVKDGPLNGYFANIDKCGNDITTFAKDFAEIGLRKGIAHILVDYNNTSGLGEISLAQKKEQNIRPYFVALDPERILGWRYDLDSNVPTLTMVRIEEDYEKPIGQWGSQRVRRVKVFERIVDKGVPLVAWTLWEHNPDAQTADEWFVVTSGYTSTKQIPLVSVYFGKRLGFLEARPPLMGVAWLNLEHWQSTSEQRNILNVARCPLWFYAGYDQSVSEGEEDTRIIVKPDAIIRATDANAKLTIVEHSGQCIGAGRQDLLDIEARMAHLSTELLTKKATSSTSATEKAHDNKGEDCKLASMMKAEEDGLTTAIGFMYEYEQTTIPEGKLVTINTSFGLEAQDAADLQTLYNSRMSGLISQATYLQELKRRGVLAASVDTAVELTSAKEDGPVELPQAAASVSAKAGAGA